MNKSLLGLAAACAAFFCGVLMFEILQFENKTIPVPAVEEVEIVEIIPFRVGQLQEAEEIEAVKKFEDKIFSGWYLLNRYKGMSEVEMISLVKDYEEDGTTGLTKISLAAGIHTSLKNYGEQGFFEAKRVVSNNYNVEFRTNKIKNIEYRFKGNFFNDKIIVQDGDKILRGTLQKFVKGEKVAEVSGDFAYYEPRCTQ